MIMFLGFRAQRAPIFVPTGTKTPSAGARDTTKACRLWYISAPLQAREKGS